MRKHFSILMSVLTILGGTTSCIDKENGEDSQYVYDYCTILANDSSNLVYTIYSDMGYEIHPTMESVSEKTEGKGFGNSSRGLMYFTFKREDITSPTADKVIINNAQYEFGTAIPCKEPISLRVADSLGVTNKDSIFEFTLGELSIINGFLNAEWNGFYSIKNKKEIAPTLHLVYDEKQLNADSLNFTIYYNRHDSINAPKDNKAWNRDCFDLVNFVKSLPASDSIVIGIKTPTEKARYAKIARTKIAYPY